MEFVSDATDRVSRLMDFLPFYHTNALLTLAQCPRRCPNGNEVGKPVARPSVFVLARRKPHTVFFSLTLLLRSVPKVVCATTTAPAKWKARRHRALSGGTRRRCSAAATTLQRQRAGRRVPAGVTVSRPPHCETRA